MKKKYVLLVLIIVISITLIISFNNRQNNKLDEVKLNEKDSEMFAIMLQNDTGYEESSNNEWPGDGYIFNSTLSGCMDINGNKIEEEGILTFENNKAIVNTSKTSYCYLYFDKEKLPGADYILKYSPDNLSEDLQGGMWRYQGTADVVDNNYICFGTKDKETCTNNPDVYMYRIIGIVGKDDTDKVDGVERDYDDTVSKGMIKVVKQTKLKEENIGSFQWDPVFDLNLTWSSSMIKKRLNGESNGNEKGSEGNTNIFLNSNNALYPYMNNTTWTDKIVSKKWYQGYIDLLLFPESANEIFNQEYGITEAGFSGEELYYAKWQQTPDDFKISLMSLSDYYLSASKNDLSSTWISNIDVYYETGHEWLSTITGLVYYMDDMLYIYTLISNGYYNMFQNESHAIRPTFYLTPDVILTGTGDKNNPYIIDN